MNRKLGDLPIGARFEYDDKGFDDGFVRHYEGEVIGTTNTRMVPVSMTRRKHWNPATGDVKFDYQQERTWEYMDGLYTVKETENENAGIHND